MINIFAGHYGSGKSTVVTNFAYTNPRKTLVVNLDIVNPYFGTSDCQDLFQKKGIAYVGPSYANTNVEVPALTGSINAIVDAVDTDVFVDVGGDDVGALALGRLSTALQRLSGGYKLYLVINKYRPLSAKTEDLCAIAEEIKEACRLQFTALINNSNLGESTTVEDICGSFVYARRASQALGLPVAYTTVWSSLWEAQRKAICAQATEALGKPKKWTINPVVNPLGTECPWMGQFLPVFLNPNKYMNGGATS